jgi:hypothetical protein
MRTVAARPQRVDLQRRPRASGVETGALDDGRRYRLQFVIALIGWVCTAAVIAWLALHAGEIEIRVTLFLAGVAVVVAVLGTSVAVDLLRPSLIRARSVELSPAEFDDTIDGLGRPLNAAHARSLTGTFTIEDDDGVRRYRRRGTA